MSFSPGRATISLTLEANEVVDDLCRRFPISERMDAGKLGFAFAIRRGFSPSARRESGGGTGTTWGVGSFDNDGQLRDLVRAILPDSTDDPYVVIEGLMNSGLLALRDDLATRHVSSLTELVDLPE